MSSGPTPFVKNLSGRRGACQRQSERGCRPFIGFAGKRQRAVMRVRDAIGYRESQAGATGFTRARVIGPIEALAQMRQMFRRDADASVAHADTRLVFLAPD